MKVIKRIALILFIFFVLLIGIAVAIPIVFKDEMVDVVKEQINTTINATADFESVSLSLLSSFPHLSVDLQNFTLIGKDQFEGVPFLSASEAGLTVDIKSLLSGDEALQVRSVHLNEPSVNVLVLADGSANYDIALAAEEEAPSEETTTTSFEVALQSYEITDGKVVYDDRSGAIYLAIDDLDHSGTGNFTLSQYDLDTKTQIGSMSVRQEGVTFLKDAVVSLDAIFNIDADNSSYTLKDNQLIVNELLLNADGNIQLTEEDIILDLSFNSPGSDFRSLWSLIPNAYTADFADVSIAGTFSLEGLVKGTYNETSYPAFRVQTKVKDGQVKYPDLPLGIKDIQADLDVNSPSADLDKMSIAADRLSLKVGNDPFEAKFKVRTPISDPDVDAQVNGIIDLAQWAKAFPLEGVQEMAGRITADVNMRTRLSTIEKERYEDVKMSGDVKVEQLRYSADGLPPVVIEKAIAQFTPQAVKIDQFDAQLGKSDISARGSVDNILAYISPEKTMRGTFTAHSDYFLVDEWMTEEETSTAAPATVGDTESEIFDRFDFQLDATADKIVYDTYELTASSMKGRVRPNLIEVADMKTKIGESDLSGSGTITNGFNYAFDDGVLGGKMDVNSRFFDLNPFMEEPEGTVTGTATEGEAEYGVIPIPPNIDMVVNAKVGELRYTDMELKNMVGKLTIAEEAVVLEDGSASALGGKLGFTGAYDTKDAAKPSYNFKFDLDKLDFQQSFSAFNTFAAFAPAGKLVTGNFSSSLIMAGVLGEDMMPLLNAVNAEGIFETLNGSLSGLQPLNAIGNALNIEDLQKSVELDNLKSWFTIANGFFEVKPFDVEVANLPMTIAGKHSLTQEMDYTVNTVIPRSMLGNGALGNTINKGVTSLLQQASQLGLNVNDAENVNVQISIKGSLTDPKVGFKLLGTNGESSLAETAKEEVKDQVNEQINAVKEDAQAQVNEVRDQVREQATAAADSLKNLANQQAQAAAQAALDQLRGQTDSTQTTGNVREQAEGAIDKIKDDIKDFNPFRRKNKKPEGGGGGE